MDRYKCGDRRGRLSSSTSVSGSILICMQRSSRRNLDALFLQINHITSSQRRLSISVNTDIRTSSPPPTTLFSALCSIPWEIAIVSHEIRGRRCRGGRAATTAKGQWNPQSHPRVATGLLPATLQTRGRNGVPGRQRLEPTFDFIRELHLIGPLGPSGRLWD